MTHTITQEQLKKMRQIRDIASGWNAIETNRDFRKIKTLCDEILSTIEKQQESAWSKIEREAETQRLKQYAHRAATQKEGE